MIRHFYIHNFKSLADFELPDLGKFACLVGLNGAGKTTVLQSFDFLAHLASGQVREWLSLHDWEAEELTNRHLSERTVTFKLRFSFDFGDLEWSGEFDPFLLRCVNETVSAEGDLLVESSNTELFVQGQFQGSSFFDFKGSVLSILRQDSELPAPIARLKDFVAGWKTLEALSPHLLRRRGRFSSDPSTWDESLPGQLAALGRPAQHGVLEDLRRFYPHVQQFWSEIDTERVVELWVNEHIVNGTGALTSNRHLNDGMLRVLSMLAETHGKHTFLQFDEIENGINPELMHKLVDYLREVPQQVLITTHNPLVLNYLPDEEARLSVIFLFRNPTGDTKGIRFFDLPTPSRKLQLLGPGEVFVDTYLEDAAREAAAI